MRDTSTAARENPAPWKANGEKGMAPPVSCHLGPPSRTSRPPQKKSHLRSPMHRLSEGTSHLKAPFGLLAATCPSHRRHMPMSLWRHAYVTLARCLCHHLRHAYVAKVRCLCRQSDIGISPAPHQKRPVYRCLGCPFFVVFGHFRHEMRIFSASEGVFRGGRQ